MRVAKVYICNKMHTSRNIMYAASKHHVEWYKNRWVSVCVDRAEKMQRKQKTQKKSQACADESEERDSKMW